MQHPVAHARTHPDKPAYVMAGTGEAVTYAQLDARANQGAHLLRSLGLKRGDGIAVLMDNSARYLEVTWAAERTGVYCTCISSKLTAKEAEYIVRDGNCQVLIASKGVAATAVALKPLVPDVATLMVGGTAEGFVSWEEARDRQPEGLIADPSPGQITIESKIV